MGCSFWFVTLCVLLKASRPQNQVQHMTHEYMTKACSMSIGGILLALFILSWGIVWLGNDLGWWNISFPFWPVIVIIIGIAILLHEVRKSI